MLSEKLYDLLVRKVRHAMNSSRQFSLIHEDVRDEITNHLRSGSATPDDLRYVHHLIEHVRKRYERANLLRRQMSRRGKHMKPLSARWLNEIEELVARYTQGRAE